MADFTLKPRSVFDAIGGCRVVLTGLTFDEAPPRALVSLTRRRGEVGTALDGKIRKAFGWALPEPGRFAEAKGVRAMFYGPGQWLIAAAREELETRVRKAADGAATVTDQSDAFVELTLAGARAREVLSRLSGLDYDDAAFSEGAVARTVMQQIAVVIARDGADSYRLNTARSTARDFAHDVETAAKSVAARAAI